MKGLPAPQFSVHYLDVEFRVELMAFEFYFSKFVTLPHHFLGVSPVLVSDLDLAIRTRCAYIITVFVFLLFWKTLFEDNREEREKRALSEMTCSLC